MLSNAAPSGESRLLGFSPGVNEKLEVAGVLTGGAVLKDAKEGEPAPGMLIGSSMTEILPCVASAGR